MSYLLTDVAQSFSKHAICASFATKWVAGNHETVTHNHHFIDLLNFCHEKVSALEVHVNAGTFGCLIENCIIGIGILNSWEEVRGDTVKKG